jgi:class 3 adenylate cyclase/tetratricopeptide (TPR) repeat protein
VPTCPTCGAASPDGFLHCGRCGAALAPPAPQRRKLVTVLFCDLSGSTALGERVDAETVRELMFSYFHEMRGALERHGGTVEKFIGDAVVAVFGVPHAHEDDALRACRAALEMRARLATLNEELERRFGSRLVVRIGVNSGEVVAGDATRRETFVTGDPVNVAARLEQAAAPGDILLGEPTYRLVREAVSVEPVPSFPVKGKSAPVTAFRLLDAGGAGPAPRRVGTPLVGRTRELADLERELDAAISRRRCRLVTIVGEPGVGKSRLAGELVQRVGARARVVRGRCLSYGEGITYWPVREIVRDAARIRDEHSAAEARARLEARLVGISERRAVAATLGELLGIAQGVATLPQTAWAIRSFLAAEARDGPLLVLVDDIHWAADALLDLLAGLPAAVSDAAILVVCLARPDLFDGRPGWDATIRLEPLARDDVDALLDGLLGGAPADVRARLRHASGGNPLFAEELVAMLVDEGVLRPENGSCMLARELDSVALPASLNALLGARLDRLDDDRRGILERGAIEGEVFHRGAVVELSPPASRQAVADGVAVLVGKELVRPAEADFVDEAAFRFRHILVREAAYRATAKKLRASLHERFAGWLERVAGGRVHEYEEILGFHLEQGYRYRAELAPVDDEARALGLRAAGWLAAAGRRALARGDVAAATNLLGRASAVLAAGGRDQLELLPDLAEAHAEAGELVAAAAIVDAGVAAAERLGDERLLAVARVERARLKCQTAPRGFLDQALEDAERAIDVLEPLGDDRGLAHAWDVVRGVHWLRGQLSPARTAADRGIVHAERAGDVRQLGWHRIWRTAAAYFGPEPFDVVDEEMARDLEWARHTGSLWLEALLVQPMGVREAARGRLDVGKPLIDRGIAIMSELGMRLFGAGTVTNWVWYVTDDPVVAEAHLRESYATLLELREQSIVSDVASMLADALFAQGRYDEAEEIAAAAAAASVPDDVSAQVLPRAIRAKILARRGEADEPESLAREAVALAYTMDYVDLRAESLLALGVVLRLAGRTAEGDEATLRAAGVYEAKGNVLFAARARQALSAVGRGA